MNRKIVVIIASLAAFVIIGSSYTGKESVQKRNLKVLPKDISEEKLDSIMSSFCVALNIDCNFCHAPSKTNPQEVDYASDDKPEKEITRKMMTMTSDINRKYFHFNEKQDPELVQAVTCFTCHRGEAHPEAKK